MAIKSRVKTKARANTSLYRSHLNKDGKKLEILIQIHLFLICSNLVFILRPQN
jgi:hypothetical protein